MVLTGEGMSYRKLGGSERLKRLKEAKERLQRDAEAGAKAVQERCATAGRRRGHRQKERGRKPKVVEPLPTEEAKANTTDPDSRYEEARVRAGLQCPGGGERGADHSSRWSDPRGQRCEQLEPMLQTMGLWRQPA